MAERLAHQLGERLGDDVVAAHHGSLSKDRRARVERRLRAGELKALVATASLELGIDIGPVELVCQIGSPRSIATFLQRVGRSNHTRVGTPKGRLYPLTRDELVECAALLAAVRAGRLDAIVPAKLPLDIAAQHVIAEVAARGVDAPTTSTSSCARPRRTPSSPARSSTRSSRSSRGGIETGRGKRGAYVHHDAVNGELRGGTGGRIAALTSGGAIPETGDYRVVAEPDDTFIGTVNEDWAVESMAGDIFLLGTHSWQIRRVEPGVVRVRDAGGARPTIPFWLGEAPARTAELSTEVSELRRHVDEHLAAGDPDGARAWLIEAAGLRRRRGRARSSTTSRSVGRCSASCRPRTISCSSGSSTTPAGCSSWCTRPYGGRINRALGLALRKKFCRTFNFELQAAATDDAIVLSLGPHHSFPLEEVPRYVSSRAVSRTRSRHAILDSPMFQARWRWNLNRSLMVLRFRNGRQATRRRSSAWSPTTSWPRCSRRRPPARTTSQGPIEIPDHVLVRQTISDTLHEALDVDGLRALLERIESGAITVHCVDTTEASVLAHEIINARPYAFLDDEELQNRRTNAVHAPAGPDGRPHRDRRARARRHRAGARRDRRPSRPPPTTSTTCCSSLRHRATPRRVAADLVDELAERGRGRVLEHRGHELWCTTERRRSGAAGARGRRARGGGRGAGSPGDLAGSPRPTRWPKRRRCPDAGRRRAGGAAERRLRAPGPVPRVARPSNGSRAACSRGCTRTRAVPAGTAPAR